MMRLIIRVLPIVGLAPLAACAAPTPAATPTPSATPLPTDTLTPAYTSTPTATATPALTPTFVPLKLPESIEGTVLYQETWGPNSGLFIVNNGDLNATVPNDALYFYDAEVHDWIISEFFVLY